MVPAALWALGSEGKDSRSFPRWEPDWARSQNKNNQIERRGPRKIQYHRYHGEITGSSNFATPYVFRPVRTCAERSPMSLVQHSNSPSSTRRFVRLRTPGEQQVADAGESAPNPVLCFNPKTGAPGHPRLCLRAGRRYLPVRLPNSGDRDNKSNPAGRTGRTGCAIAWLEMRAVAWKIGRRKARY